MNNKTSILAGASTAANAPRQVRGPNLTFSKESPPVVESYTGWLSSWADWDFADEVGGVDFELNPGPPHPLATFAPSSGQLHNNDWLAAWLGWYQHGEADG